MLDEIGTRRDSRPSCSIGLAGGGLRKRLEFSGEKRLVLENRVDG
jgi:hypothetical protein